jgi:AcrR family transcriptional regulator
MSIVNIEDRAASEVFRVRARREENIAKRYHHGDLRAALLSVAADMLEKQGAEAISFRAVARAVGVTQTAPYNHFASKEALLAALATEGFARLLASQTRALATEADGSDAIVALGLDYVRFAMSQPQRYRLMFGAGIKDRCAFAETAEAKRASFGPLKEALAKRLHRSEQAALDIVAVTAWAFVHGLASLIIDGSLQQDRHIDIAQESSVVRRAIETFGRKLGSG